MQFRAIDPVPPCPESPDTMHGSLGWGGAHPLRLALDDAHGGHRPRRGSLAVAGKRDLHPLAHRALHATKAPELLRAAEGARHAARASAAAATGLILFVVIVAALGGTPPSRRRLPRRSSLV